MYVVFYTIDASSNKNLRFVKLNALDGSIIFVKGTQGSGRYSDWLDHQQIKLSRDNNFLYVPHNL